MEEVIGSNPIFSTTADHRSAFFMFTVYILYSQKCDKYYVGSTGDLLRRLSEHNSRTGHFTTSCAPWKVVYSETFSTRREAVSREREIKSKKSRTYIEM